MRLIQGGRNEPQDGVKNDHLRQFVYVDFRYKGRAWGRCHAGSISENVIIPSNNQNCFVSVQRFSDPKSPLHADRTPQPHYCGYFFDLDSDPSSYNGNEEEALEVAKIDAKKIVEFFLGLDVEEPLIRVWYSGRKGFHIIVHPKALGVSPSEHNSYIMRHGAVELIYRLGLKTLDLSVYTHRRLWRIPSSIHETSGRFKIELYHQQLDLPSKEIFELAKTSQGEAFDKCEYQDVQIEDLAGEFWSGLVNGYERKLTLDSLRPRRRVINTEKWPACIMDLMENPQKCLSGDAGKPNNRNKAVMALASYFKDTGVPKAEAESMLLEWTNRLPGVSKLQERLINAKAVVHSVYEVPDTRTCFNCRFIRAVTHDKDRSDKIKCTEKTPEGCDAIENDPSRMEPAKMPRVPLYKASQAEYIGTKVNIPVMVIGKGTAPYGYPTEASVFCHPDLESSLCQSCKIAEHGGEYFSGIDVEQFEIMDLIECPKEKVHAVIKRHFGIPNRCRAHRMDVTGYGNVQQVHLQPDVLASGLYTPRPGEAVESNTVEDGKFCQRIGYYIGHDIDVNRKYEVSAWVSCHPRDQQICHVFDNAIPSQDDIDQVHKNKNIGPALKIFQPAKGQSVRDKFDEIHDDLERNVHMIWGRREVSVAVDLVYHSALHFSLSGLPVKKGWMELLILGDSGNGKTHLVEKMMNHYQLGEMTGVEGGKRTGLLYGNHQVAGRYMLVFGKIPQNDRRLLALDEFSGMSDEEVAMMTRPRGEGILETQGINTAVTMCRCRLIFLSNARNGKPLDQHNYGIEAVHKLFREHQDVRRLDMAVCVRSGDVTIERLNKIPDPDMSTHKYTSGLCKALVLWAWSRRPEQISFTDEATKKVYEVAASLGKKYRCDVKLVEPSDMRLKVARMSVATAARMFSTDDGQGIIVREEHVEFAEWFYRKIYNHKAMQYDVYADAAKSRMFMSDKKKSKLKQKWYEEKYPTKLLRYLLDGTSFRKSDLADVGGFDRDKLSSFVGFLIENHLMVTTRDGFRKTPIFTQWLQEYWNIDDTDPPF